MQPAEELAHMHRDADDAGLFGKAAADRLADPPGGIGGELEALGVVELLDRTDEADVAFLDEVEEGRAAAGVALRHRRDEPQVRLDQMGLGSYAVTGQPS